MKILWYVMGGRCCSDNNYFTNINIERVIYHSEYYISFRCSYFHVEKNSNLGLKYNKNTKILITFIKWETLAQWILWNFQGKSFLQNNSERQLKNKWYFPSKFKMLNLWIQLKLSSLIYFLGKHIIVIVCSVHNGFVIANCKA